MFEPVSWTNERVAQLETLWAEGLTSTQIANHLGGITRNSVIGKVHRLKLGSRSPLKPKPARMYHRNAGASRSIATPRETKARQKFAGNPVVRELFKTQTFVPTPELVIPLKERKHLLQLEDSNCKWPIGDPHHADFHFCGRHRILALPYCEYHARKAFQPPQPRHRLPPIIAVKDNAKEFV